MSMITLRKEDIYLGMNYSFRGIVSSSHGRKHEGMMTDMMFEKKLRVLHPDQQIAGS